jgi:hypothetical protein
MPKLWLKTLSSKPEIRNKSKIRIGKNMKAKGFVLLNLFGFVVLRSHAKGIQSPSRGNAFQDAGEMMGANNNRGRSPSNFCTPLGWWKFTKICTAGTCVSGGRWMVPFS